MRNPICAIQNPELSFITIHGVSYEKNNVVVVSFLCLSFGFDKAEMLDGTTRLTCKGKSIKQLARLGTFSEYIVVPEMLIVKVSRTKPCEY